jgi:hypothetical protein
MKHKVAQAVPGPLFQVRAPAKMERSSLQLFIPKTLMRHYDCRRISYQDQHLR